MKKIPAYTPQELLPIIRKFMAQRYSEGYTKGVHDEDAKLILHHLLKINKNIDLLRYSADSRACANLYWNIFEEEKRKKLLNDQIKSTGLILQLFPETTHFVELLEQLEIGIESFVTKTNLFEKDTIKFAAEYLFYELTRSDSFIISSEAAQLQEKFKVFLKEKHFLEKYEQSLLRLESQAQQKIELLRNWLIAYLHEKKQFSLYQKYLNETAALLLLDNYSPINVKNVKTKVAIENVSGTHQVIEKGGIYSFDYQGFMQKMRDYQKNTVPQYQHFANLKKQLGEQFKKQLRLEEFKPRVLSSFVRNQLIDKVYLPILGDNLAKQIGVVGENKRTDLMGMLLLISPPGYGKTTLMEYICSRLGLIFMKINGPAIGHNVTSLDPSEAQNASARQELNKLNLAFEMGDNIMIYLDDIQHCNPEFLQKFISLCDGQRKIEGVYKGESKTYDLRGKKVCVVMAGNPYTESGDKFQVPDMLTNRADTYNLGDIIGDSADLFKLSYLENCLTSNAILNRLATKSMKDVLSLIHIAATDNMDGIEYEANHTSDELNEYINVLKKLIRVRDVVLLVNQEYIKSAAQEDQYRTEPSFKLQGSYRDMNKLAEKIVPIMNEKELESLIVSHYISESQTLTTGAEANMLKFKELISILSEAEAERWAEIKLTFKRNLVLGGAGEDRIGQIVGQMSAISQGLDGYLDAFVSGLEGIQRALGVEPKKK
ncbi:MAG: AAA family ATPase [Chitinophagales bacterium]